MSRRPDEPQPDLWNSLVGCIEQDDAVILTLKEYAQALTMPQLCFMPAIDPFSIKNRALSEADIVDRLAPYDIPTDLPLVVQISRVGRWKAPAGVIQAFQMARRDVPCTLVLLGNVATDAPEGEQVEALRQYRDECLRILSAQDSALVNALQRRATVVLQKAIREGFGLTVTEAMWTGAAVIGGNVGGIHAQITDGENGFLVSSVAEAAQRLVQVLNDAEWHKRLGQAARETVSQRFLMIRLLEPYVDLFNAFETVYRLDKSPGELS